MKKRIVSMPVTEFNKELASKYKKDVFRLAYFITENSIICYRVYWEKEKKHALDNELTNEFKSHFGKDVEFHSADNTIPYTLIKEFANLVVWDGFESGSVENLTDRVSKFKQHFAENFDYEDIFAVLYMEDHRHPHLVVCYDSISGMNHAEGGLKNAHIWLLDGSWHTYHKLRDGRPISNLAKILEKGAVLSTGKKGRLGAKMNYAPRYEFYKSSDVKIEGWPVVDSLKTALAHSIVEPICMIKDNDKEFTVLVQKRDDISEEVSLWSNTEYNPREWAVEQSKKTGVKINAIDAAYARPDELKRFCNLSDKDAIYFEGVQ